jgi:CHAT domain-containing protein
MKKYTILFLSICLSIPLFAQEGYTQYMDLSYEEIDSLMNSSYSKAAYSKAITFAKAGQEKAKGEFGELDTIFASYCAWEGFLHQHNGKYALAMPLLTQAKNIYGKVKGEEHPDFALSLNNLANLYTEMGDFSNALPLLIQSKNIRGKVKGEEHADYAQSLNNLAHLYTEMGDFSKALPLFIQSKSIYTKVFGEEHLEFARSLNNLARLYVYMGNFSEALPLYIQAKEVYEKVLGKEHPDLAQSLSNLAYLYYNMGRFSAALPLLMQTKDIYEKILGPEHPYFARSLNNLASLYQEMNNLAAALPLSIQALAIYEKALGKEHPEYANSLTNLAHLYKRMELYEKALPLFIEAKAIRERSLGKKHPLFANSLHHLASLYQKIEQYDKALPLYLEAKDISEENLGKEHPDFAFSLNLIASLYYKMEDFGNAWKVTKEAMNSSSGILIEHNFDLAWSDSLLNAPFASNRHIEKMLTSLRISYSLLRKDSSIQDASRKQIMVTDLATDLLTKFRAEVVDEKDKLRMLEVSSDWVKRGLKVLNLEEDATKAFNLADQNKSVLLSQATKSEAVYHLGELPDSLVWQNKKMLKKQSQLEAKLIEKRSKTEKDSLRTVLIDLNQEIDGFIAGIKKDYPKYYKLKYQQVETRAEEIQALLDDETALLEYVISDSILHIFYVQKEKLVWKKELVLDSVLEANVKDLHESLSDYGQISKQKKQNLETYSTLAYWFYQTILAPVLTDKEEIKNLIIVSDGVLGHLPFEAFLVEAVSKPADYKNLHYLVKDYNISYNYSASLWQENKSNPKPRNNGQMMAMAAYYSNDIDRSLVRGRLPTTLQMRDALSPLPAAKEEVEALANQFKGYFAFDSLASERVLYEKAADYAIIHLAMHGLLDEKRPILSSLALTEDGDSLYDNFWQAHEISKMELNADLVVLSACETGYGRFETGNGIASLARAFMYAGVPSLVVSLWQVNDQSTSIIMQNFYKHLANGKTKSAALRQAKLDYIEKVDNPIAAHPAFWSPFILIGDESPVQIAQKWGGSWIFWAVGVGALALAAIALGLARRKRVA